MALKYADNVGSQLDDAIDEAAVFCVVESVSSFPANISPTDFAVATIANDDNSLTESIKITFIDRPNRTLTIERGYDDSTPRDWPKGSKLEIRLSAGFIRALEAQVNAYTDGAIDTLETSTANTTTAKSKAAFAIAFVLS
jgi:hypothetical protein